MRKKECPSCAMDIDMASSECPICGYEFSRPFGITRLVAIGLLVIILVYIVLQWIG